MGGALWRCYQAMMECQKSKDEVNSQVSFCLPQPLFLKLSRAANENKTDVYTELVQRLEASFESSPEDANADIVNSLSQKFQEALTPIREMSKSIMDSLGSELKTGLARIQGVVDEASAKKGPQDATPETPQMDSSDNACKTNEDEVHRVYSALNEEENEILKRVEAKHDFIEEHSELFQEEMEKDPHASLNIIFKRVKDRLNQNNQKNDADC